MVVQEFIDRMGKMEVLTYVGLDDWFDRLNFIFTVWILMLMCSVTTVKTYFLQPIICYIPTIVGSHEGQAAYVTNYCYTEGTYNVPLAEFKVDNENPHWLDAYKDRKIYYYQWLPFILGLQGVLCYVPRIFWYLFINNRSGTDLTQLVRQSMEVQKAESDRREKLVKNISRQIELWIKGNFVIHNRRCCVTLRKTGAEPRKHQRTAEQKNCFEEIRCCVLMRQQETLEQQETQQQQITLEQQETKQQQITLEQQEAVEEQRSCHLLCSKRLATWLMWLYLLVKVIYIGNAAGQLLLMTRLLQLPDLTSNKNSSLLGIAATFGANLLTDLLQGRDWQNTEAFPRSGCCAIETRQAASSQYIFAQCALPVNMIHEKLFIFLWFWFVFLLLMNALSVPLWLNRFCNAFTKNGIVIKYLRLSGVVSKKDTNNMSLGLMFCRRFLRFDGVFLIHMLALNAGDVVASEICDELFTIFQSKYQSVLEDRSEHDISRASANSRYNKQNGWLQTNELADQQSFPLIDKSQSSTSLNRPNGRRKKLHPVSEDGAAVFPTAETPTQIGAEFKLPTAPPAECSL